MKVEYCYSMTTGTVDDTRAIIQNALAQAGLSADIDYIEVIDDADAHKKHFLGPPTIRINGLDVEFQERESPEYHVGTRFYSTTDGWKPYPTTGQIFRLLSAQLERELRSTDGT